MKKTNVIRIELKKNEYRALVEALRRWCSFEHTGGNTLETAWTGLGTKTNYKDAIEAGLMAFAHPYSKGCMGWLVLTPLGAKIIQKWLDLGFKAEDYEVKTPPPSKIDILG
jgi:hypothetical protein